MACNNCLGAGLKLDGDGNPALNPDPTGGLAVSAATCLASRPRSSPNTRQIRANCAGSLRPLGIHAGGMSGASVSST